MIATPSRSLFAALVFASCILSPAAAKAPPWVPSEGVGSVHMPISCTAVQKEFDRGLALLYSFWYDRAVAVFDDVIATDPQCRIAYWGAAMTYNHPLWAPPTADDVKHALDYVRRGRTANEYGEREAGYFSAVATLFGDGNPETKDARDTQYMNQMAQLYSRYPDDDTALFYALSIEGSPGYTRDASKIERAGALAQAVHRNKPQHPGALHYIIHAYDEPGYEARALDAARAYAASAPSIPHALHMPSHTFLALGLWDESNATNARAWAASEQSVKDAGQHAYDRDFHTFLFYEYGELQAGHYAKARQLRDVALDEYREIVRGYRTMPKEQADDTFDAGDVALTIAACAYETGDYSAVNAITSDGLDGVWEASHLEVEALAALAAHDASKTSATAAALQKFVSANESQYSPNGKRYVSIALEEVDGLDAIASGNVDNGLAFLKRAADDESHLSAVFQPALVPPAHELYATQLLKNRRYAEAAANFRIALALTPNRPKALFGLALASQQLHDNATASASMAKFNQVWKTADRSAAAALSDANEKL